MFRRSFLAVSVCAAPGLLTSCGRLRSKASRMQLRVSASNHFSMCPFYLALESGYFAAAGFDIEVARNTQTPQSLPLMAGGKLDVGFVGFGPSVVNAVIRGARVRLVAGREVVSGSCGSMGTIYVSRKAFPNGVRTMRQLQGRRIGFSGTSPGTGFMLGMMLENEGMQAKDIVLMRMREPECVAAVRAGGLDAVFCGEAGFSPEMQRLDLVRGPSIADLQPNLQYSYIAFGRRLLDGPAETGARFLRAYFRGAREFRGGRTPRFLDDFAKSADLDPNMLRQTCRATFERDGSIHLEDLRRAMQWMSAEGLCPASVDAGALVDARFLEASRTADQQ